VWETKEPQDPTKEPDMTITARKATARIATDSADLLDLITFGTLDDEFETCELGDHFAAELYTRTDNRDGSEILVCEHCADTADVSCSDDYDA
jgi:hypothetical protein